MISSSSFLRTIVSGLSVFLMVSLAPAQDFPTHAISVVVPTTAGGPLDLAARFLQPRFAAAAGQPVIIENRPGAGTYIGGEYVAKSAPDGYTLLVNITSALFPELFMSGPSTVLSEGLVPVAPIGFAPFLFFTPSQTPANNLRDFVQLIRANPNKYNVAKIPGAYSTLQILNFVKANDMHMLEVPYNSTANIVAAMLRNEVHLYAGAISGAKPNIDSGRLRALAIVGSARSPLLPGVPTAKELGIDVDVNGDNALFAPARTPQPTINLLNEKIGLALASQEARQGLGALGFEPQSESPAAIKAKFERLSLEIHKAVREAGITPQ
jgi:tripartite-type tricarboxylate transporter receptor subunit TctC